MSDLESRTLEREDWRSPRALAARVRDGNRRLCLFCEHALTGMPTCSHVEGYKVGDAVYQRVRDTNKAHNVCIGRYVGDNKIAVDTMRGPVHAEAMAVFGQPGIFIANTLIELPESWQPPPCGCDHSNIPDAQSMQEYQAKWGCDIRIAKSLKYGQTLHHWREKNADGSPLRHRVAGALKTWKRDPNRFRIPLHYGFYGPNTYLEPHNAREFRTEVEYVPKIFT